MWYVGGLTGWTEREYVVDLSKLGEGPWNVELFADGVNADHNGKDYKKSNFSASGSFKVTMAPGGGFAARLTR